MFEWLILHGNNIYDKPLNEFQTFLENVEPNENHLTNLFQDRFIEGYGKIVNDFCEGYFIAWEQKKQIYCWDGEWKVFKEEELLKIISKIQKKVMNLYSEWSKKF